jgi:hypothetical protein
VSKVLLLTSLSGDEGMAAAYIKSAFSKTFKGKMLRLIVQSSERGLSFISVYSSAKCPPPLPSTFLTKHLQEQGVKLRTKKTQNPQYESIPRETNERRAKEQNRDEPDEKTKTQSTSEICGSNVWLFWANHCVV